MSLPKLDDNIQRRRSGEPFDSPITVDKEKSGLQQSWDRKNLADRQRVVIAEMARDHMQDMARQGKEITYDQAHREMVKVAEYRDRHKR